MSAAGVERPAPRDAGTFLAAFTALRRTDLQAALRLAEDQLERALASGDTALEQIALGCKGVAVLHTEGPNAALELLEPVLKVVQGGATLQSVVVEAAHLECLVESGRLGSAIELLPDVASRVEAVAPPAFACAFEWLEQSARTEAESDDDPWQPIRELRRYGTEHGADWLLARADYMESWRLHEEGRLDEAVERSAAVLLAAEAAGDRDLIAQTCYAQSYWHWAADRNAQSLIPLDRGQDAAQLLGSRIGVGHHEIHRAFALRDGDRIDEAWEACVRADEAIAGRGFTWMESGMLDASISIAALRGDHDSVTQLHGRRKKLLADTDAVMHWVEVARANRSLSAVDRQRDEDRAAQVQDAARRERVVDRWQRSALALVSALLVVVFFSRRQVRRTNQRLQEEILATQEAQAARAESEQQLQNLERLKGLGVMAGGIAHDFNNLLTGVLGNADMLLGTAEPGSATQLRLREIVDAGERAASLCQRLLVYAGKVPPRPDKVDLNRLLPDLLPSLRSSVRDGVTVQLSVAQSAAWVDVDRTQIDQVLMNLCLNAAEAEASSIWLGVEHAHIDASTPSRPAELTDGEYVAIRCRDNGVGLSEEACKRVFEPFYTTRFDGRGLGLAEVYGIAQEHGGCSTAANGVDGGAVFQIFLPALGAEPRSSGAPQEDDAPVEDPPRLSEVTIIPTTCPVRLEGEAVVVDDESAPRNLAASILRRAGMRVTSFADGESALHYLRQQGEGARVLVLDVTMPGLSGIDVLAQARPLYPELPVLLMSGHFEVQGLKDLGGEPPPVLTKPFREGDLREAVAELLSTVPGEPPLLAPRTDR